MPILTTAERNQLLVEWNDTARAYPLDKCVHQLFEDQVKRTPDAVAVVFEGEQMTYRELNERANQLAGRLQSKGVKEDVIVGLCVKRSLEMVVGMLGILKAGGAYLPLDPEYPNERLSYIVDDSGAEIIVTESSLTSLFGESDDSCLLVDAESSNTAEVSILNMPSTPSSLAYVIYTSGSTGKPKGVAIEHSNATSFLHWVQETFTDNELAGVLAVTSICFDISVFEIFGPLSWGGKIILVKSALDDVSDQNWSSVTLINTVPSLMETWLRTRTPPPSLLTINLAGEFLKPSLVDAIYKSWPVQRVNDLYGPSETTIYSTWTTREPGKPASIGKPITNTQVYVLDANLNPVPSGIQGDLYIAGAGVARGYLHRPDLTAERFVKNPFRSDSNARIYRTGDRARFSPDGSLEYLGRVDQQVKIRGFRIELGEIEIVLEGHSKIRAATVIVSPTDPDDISLTAFLVLEEPNSLDTEAVRRWLLHTLPEYMVPSRFSVLESLPLTPNGKVDRKALPSPKLDRAYAGVDYTAPRNPIEEELATIWSDVLGLDRVGVLDNFFALGGHSLIATQVVSRIRSIFEVNLPLRRLFDAPTIGELAEDIDALRHGGNQSTTADLKMIDRARADPLPLSFAQQRLWFLDQLEGGLTAYNLPSAHRLKGELNVEALRLALEFIARRHEALRTIFELAGGDPVQVIKDIEHFELPLVDLAPFSPDDRETEISRLRQEEAECPFDLACDPMLRASLLQIEAVDHILLLTMHHIASDGWSMGIVWRELSAYYASFATGQEPEPPHLSIQYSDYAVWQRKQLNGERLKGLLQYWRGQLDGISPLELPTDHPRPPVPTYRGALHEFEVPGELTDLLQSLSHAEGVTLNMTLLAAFQVLLARYSGQEDIVVGMPTAGRNHEDLEGLIGFFVNTLVLRSDLSGNPTFQDLLAQVRETSLGAYDHQELPFEKLVEELQPERDPSRSPLFQVLFQLLDFGDQEHHLGELKIKTIPSASERTRFDLEMHLWQQPKNLKGVISYRTDLFDGATIKRLTEHFLTLLAGIVAAPQRPIGKLPLLTEAENNQLLVEWNETTVDYPDKCVHQHFEEQVERTPDAIAVTFEDKQLTYRELNKRANQLAHCLIERDVGPEIVVGICVERSLELVIGILGILKSGGAYLPLHPDHPPERLELILQNAEVKHLVSNSSLINRLPEKGLRVLLLDIESQEIARFQIGNLVDERDLDALAYVMFTSGSTGQPKGVAMSHSSLINLIEWHLEQPRLNKPAQTLQFASCTFDVSFQEIWTTWACGGSVVLVTEEIRSDPGALWQFIVDRRVERLFIPYVALQQLANARKRTDRSALCDIISAGEALHLTPEICHFVKELKDCRLHNHYGPTETHVVTSYLLEAETENWRAESSIGRPIANTQIYILNEVLHPLPIGVAGELYIGGAGLARGYLNRPDLTKERFVEVKILGKTERLYRTGDLCRWKPDGNLEFIGRIDHQVKIRGFRIELGEIETALGLLPGIKECVVIAREDRPGEKVLVAYFVSDQKKNVSIQVLRRALAEKLPDYMIPAAFVPLEILPLTPNGKFDRKALPAPEFDRTSAGVNYIAPRNPIEEELASIWSEVLGLDRVGVHDNFFHLGGHSLMAVVMLSKVNDLLDLEIPLRWIFEYPTIESLSKQITIEKNSPDGKSRNNGLIPTVDRQAPLPMSFAQQGMWLLQQTLQDPAAYNVSTAWQLEGSVDPTRLRQCLRIIQSRHEVLRTGLTEKNGKLLQFVLESETCLLPWQEVDLSTLDGDRLSAARNQQLKDEARQSFDLASPPLWRVLWLKCDEQNCTAIFTFHHSIIDEWSLQIFSRELNLCYEDSERNEPALLPALPVQYGDYAVWQKDRLAGKELEALNDYWHKRLRNLAPNLSLPVDIPEQSEGSCQGSVQRFQLTGQVVSRLRALSREENATAFMTALAAFQVWLYRYTGQNDLVVATPITERDRPEIQNLLGLFLNTLPIRSQLKHGQSFREILREFRKSVIEDFNHATLPFAKIVELAVKERDANSRPLHKVMIVLLEQGLPELKLGSATGHQIPISTHTSKCDLTFIVAASEHVWDCQLEYASDLFTEQTAMRMVAHLKELLEAIAEAPQEPIEKLRLIPKAELNQLLVEWNDTARAYPRDKCVHQLFEDQVKRTPDALAVVFDGDEVTYRELNARANRLAHHLGSLVVGPDFLVGLCTLRSVEMIIALLGILKAGGAYVPIDPKLPRERLRLLLSDIDSPVILCQRQWRENISALAEETCPNSQILTLEDLLESLKANDQANPICTNRPEDLSYVMYTSGTTGIPKGVMVPHRGIVRLVIEPNYVELGPDDVMLQFAPLPFDASTFEIWGSLLNGAKLVIPSSESLSFPELGKAITENRITTLWLTAALFHEMMEHEPSSLVGVRQLMVGGDVLLPAKVREYLEMAGHGVIINGYGPTENTTFTTCARIDQSTEIGESVTIGRPIAGTNVYILDQHKMPVPVGVVGELYTGGDGLARGYLNSPDLTAKRFVQDPYSEDPETKLYQTGDLVRWNSDGGIEFVGRADHQVKIRGYRIEPGEIENALCRCDSVSEAVVIDCKTESGETQLHAYLQTQTEPDLRALRAELAEMLPKYMIPNGFFILKQLPLTPNGKVDRRALSEIEAVKIRFEQKHEEPRTELERRLVSIWKDVLGVERVGIQDNFFDLGGHSLQAALLATKIEKLVGKRLPILSFFQSPTIASLASRLTDQEWAPKWSSLVPLQPIGSKPPLFFLHGWGGDVYGFTELAKHFAPEQPIYGIQAVGLDERQPRHRSVEEMASHYVEEIRSFQAEGPYHLCGYSMGGLIAFETAQQLRKQGQQVAVLCLLDTHPIGPIPLILRILFLMLHLPKRFLVHLGEFLKIPLAEKTQYLRGRLIALKKLILRNQQKPRIQKILETEGTLKETASPDYCHQIALFYRPTTYSSSLNLILSEATGFTVKLYWQFISRGRARFRRVSCSHRDMIAPKNLPDLVEGLASIIKCSRKENLQELSRNNFDENKDS
jgi:amino acid adenylation domain-containing protein